MITTTRTIEKRRTITESGGALRERDRVLGVPGDVARADRLRQVVELLLDPDPLEAVVVEPLSGGGRCRPPTPVLPVDRALLGQVGVDPVGSRACLRDDDGAERNEERRRTRVAKTTEDDGDGERRAAAGAGCRSRTSGLSVNAITAAVRNRKRTCPSVLAKRNARRSSDGKADELDPARDPDRRSLKVRRAADLSLGSVTPPIVALRGRGPTAGDEARSACATVAPMASPRSRQAARLRERRRRAQQRARRLVVLSVLGGARRRHAALHGLRLERLVARVGADRDRHGVVRRRRRDPAAAAGARVDREPADPAPGRGRGAHGDRVPRLERRLALAPAGRAPGERGLLARLWRRIAGSGRDSPRWYQLEGGPPARTSSTSGRRPGTDVYAPVEGLGHRRQRPRRRRQARRQPDRPAAVRGAVGDGLGDERPARPVDRGRHSRARRVRRSSARPSTSPRSRGRPSPRTRPTAATTSRSPSTRRPARCP